MTYVIIIHNTRQTLITKFALRQKSPRNRQRTKEVIEKEARL